MILPPSSLLPSASIPEVGMWTKQIQVEYKNIQEVLDYYCPLLSPLYFDYNSATNFYQIFVKTLTTLNVSKDFLGETMYFSFI